MLSRAGLASAQSQDFDDAEDMPFPELQQEQPVRTTVAERRAAADKLIAAWPPIETPAAAAAGADGGERLEAEHQHHQRADPTSAGADEGAQLGAERCSQASGDVTPELLSQASCIDSPESEANQDWNWIVIDNERCDEPSSPTLPLPGPGKCCGDSDSSAGEGAQLEAQSHHQRRGDPRAEAAKETRAATECAVASARLGVKRNQEHRGDERAAKEARDATYDDSHLEESQQQD